MAADDRYVAFKPMSWAELTSEAEDLRVIWQRLRDQVHELKDHANAGISDNRRITGAAAFELAESSLTSEGDATDSQIAAAFNANVNNLNYMALHDLKTRIRKRIEELNTIVTSLQTQQANADAENARLVDCRLPLLNAPSAPRAMLALPTRTPALVISGPPMPSNNNTLAPGMLLRWYTNHKAQEIQRRYDRGVDSATTIARLTAERDQARAEVRRLLAERKAIPEIFEVETRRDVAKLDGNTPPEALPEITTPSMQPLPLVEETMKPKRSRRRATRSKPLKQVLESVPVAAAGNSASTDEAALSSTLLLVENVNGSDTLSSGAWAETPSTPEALHSTKTHGSCPARGADRAANSEGRESVASPALIADNSSEAYYTASEGVPDPTTVKKSKKRRPHRSKKEKGPMSPPQ